MNPFEWHELASRAAYLCGVADDTVAEATRGTGLTLSDICETLDRADAALCSALRELTQARAQAGLLKSMLMEE